MSWLRRILTRISELGVDESYVATKKAPSSISEQLKFEHQPQLHKSRRVNASSIPHPQVQLALHLSNMVSAVKVAKLSTPTIGTHSGPFHVDEVLACVMLQTLPHYRDCRIIRSRDAATLAPCDIIVDVGGVFDASARRFDHHQATFTHSMTTLHPTKPWTTKLSSAGLIYAHFGRQVLAHAMSIPGAPTSANLDSEEVPIFAAMADNDKRKLDVIYDKMYENFVEEIDGNDNGINQWEGGKARYRVTTTLGSRVANLRPWWNDPAAAVTPETERMDVAFHKAVALVKAEWTDRLGYYSDCWWPARQIVADAVVNRHKAHASGRVIEFQSGATVPFKEHLFDIEREMDIIGEVAFAIFTERLERADGTDLERFRVLAINVSPESPYESRMPLKKEWRGLRDEALAKAANCPGATFVHASGFTGGHATREGVIHMIEETMRSAAEVGGVN